MNNLSARELKIFNNLSRVQSPSVSLGTRIQEIIDGMPVEEGTPVNAVAATEVLTLAGVVIHGETVTIDNPAAVGADVYEFLSDSAQSKTIPTNIAVDISASTVNSVGTLTVDTQPTSGDTMTIGTKVYTFVPAGTDTADGEISIGTDLATAQLAIVAAINGADDVNLPHPFVSASAFVADVCTILALVGGVAGDDLATTATFTAVTNVFATATLITGSDCTAANAITALVAAITSDDTQGVRGADGDGDTIDLTADIAGEAGNLIAVETTMANGSFVGTELAGGVNGTTGLMGRVMIDATYLYIAIADNTVADTNWRRIAVGAAY